MAEAVFDGYLREINEAYLRGDATEQTHRPALGEEMKGCILVVGR